MLKLAAGLFSLIGKGREPSWVSYVIQLLSIFWYYFSHGFSFWFWCTDAPSYWFRQDLPSHTSTGRYDIFMSPSWQPWPSQSRTENRRWGQFHGSSNIQKAEKPTACGGYSAVMSLQQDLVLHQWCTAHCFPIGCKHDRFCLVQESILTMLTLLRLIQFFPILGIFMIVVILCQ